MKVLHILRKVDPSEIKRIIENGDAVDYDHIFIDGYLDLSNLNLPHRKISRNTEELQTLGVSENKKVIKSQIKITNSRIKWMKCKDVIFISSIDFTGTEFQQPTDFSGTIFCCPTFFMNSIFFQSWFQGTVFCKEATFIGAEFKTHADFRNVVSCQSMDFSNTRFGSEPKRYSHGVNFSKAKFLGKAKFNSVTFDGQEDFKEICFKNDVEFFDAIFLTEAYFDNSEFGKYTGFLGARFCKAANFIGAVFLYNVTFMEAHFERRADFSNAAFHGIVSFMDAKFNGESLSFKDAAFSMAKYQEDACVKAKKVLDDHGKREEADYHFYREMEAKRRQRGSSYEYFDYDILLSHRITAEEIRPRELRDLWKYIRYNLIEYFILQVIFGYGVHPFRLWGWWFFFVFLFAAIYWLGNGVKDATTEQQLSGMLEYIWFSITVAVTPGFAGGEPIGLFRIMTGLEAIFGTFMWAAFITTFAKKYMR